MSSAKVVEEADNHVGADWKGEELRVGEGGQYEEAGGQSGERGSQGREHGGGNLQCEGLSEQSICGSYPHLRGLLHPQKCQQV